MAKIKLEAEPTFKAFVPIPVPGAKTTPVEFTFKHRTRKAIVEWLEANKDDDDVKMVQSVATAWELDDEFNAASIAKLCDNYAGAGYAIIQTYLDELRGARAKN